MDEFELIREYFRELTPARADIVLGIGDDCALLQAPAGEQLAVTTDTLVAGRHFPDSTSPYNIGWKSLAASLSDLAAMGAEPRWFLLALTLPEASKSWLQAFSQGLRDLALRYNIALVGGDTTRGPLSVTITAAGVVPAEGALRRSGAKPGDLVCVTGSLGDAALALRALKGRQSLLSRVTAGRFNLAVPAGLKRVPKVAEMEALQDRLDRPSPRVRTGIALRGLASAVIDISDGLAGDLQHILDASGVGADVWVDRLPASEEFKELAPDEHRHALQLGGGDDYELCVCLPGTLFKDAKKKVVTALIVVGVITERAGLRYMDDMGREVRPQVTGYRHFGGG